MPKRRRDVNERVKHLVDEATDEDREPRKMAQSFHDDPRRDTDQVRGPNTRFHNRDGRLWTKFARNAGLGDAATLVDVVEAIRSLPYGRPNDRTPTGVVADWRGTCSTKHALLAELAATRWPELEPRIVHRVYRLTPDLARTLFGEETATAVPPEGLTDVHSYVTLLMKGRRVRVDATVPGPDWDGRSDMRLACGDGLDVDGGDDPWATKSALLQEHCDDDVRERVITALAEWP